MKLIYKFNLLFLILFISAYFLISRWWHYHLFFHEFIDDNILLIWLIFFLISISVYLVFFAIKTIYSRTFSFLWMLFNIFIGFSVIFLGELPYNRYDYFELAGVLGIYFCIITFIGFILSFVIFGLFRNGRA